MILIDTSAWIGFFRDEAPWADAVDQALEANEAALCGPIRTELQRGLRTRERDRVLKLLEGCHWLPQPTRLWEDAGELGYRLQRKGRTIKTMDLLIAVYALAASVPILTADRDFRLIAKADDGLRILG